jgi:hypothetical protein
MIKYILVLLPVLGLFSCYDIKPTESSSGFNMNNRYGELVDTTIIADLDTTVLGATLSTASSGKFSVGVHQSFQASSLLKFTLMPADTVNIDSFYIQLWLYGKVKDNLESFTIGLYDVEQEWDETANTDAYWHDSPALTKIQEYEVTESDTAAIRIYIQDTSLVNKWRREQSDNLGILLRQEAGAENILEFVSNKTLETTKWPRVGYKIQVNDTTVTYDSLNVANMATIFDYTPMGENIFELAKTNQDLLIASGIPAQTILTFPGLKQLPPYSIIHKTNLILDVNNEDFLMPGTENSLDNRLHDEEYYIRNIVEMDETLENLEVDSTYLISSGYNILMTQDGDSLQLSSYQQESFSDRFIQPILDGDTESKGFLIKYRNEVQDISVKRLNSSKIRKPRLRVQYYLLKNAGY